MREYQLLVGATLHLMSRHADHRSARVAETVARHLELLGAHPLSGGVMRQWATELARDWRSLVERSRGSMR